MVFYYHFTRFFLLVKSFTLCLQDLLPLLTDFMEFNPANWNLLFQVSIGIFFCCQTAYKNSSIYPISVLVLPVLGSLILQKNLCNIGNLGRRDHHTEGISHRLQAAGDCQDHALLVGQKST